MKKTALAYFLRFYQNAWKEIILWTGILVLQSALALPVAWLVKYTFDSAILENQATFIILAGLGVAGLQIFGNVLLLCARSGMVKLNKTATASMREDILRSLYRLSRAFYAETDWSKLQTNVMLEMERVDRLGELVLSQLFPAAITILGLIIYLIYLNPVLFLILALVSPLLWILNRFTTKNMNQVLEHLREATRIYNQGLQSIIQLIDLTRIQTAEEMELQKQQAGIKNLAKASVSWAWTRNSHSLAQETLIMLAMVVILVGGGWLVTNGQMTLGGLVAFYAGVALIRGPLQTLSGNIPQAVEGLQAVQIMHDLRFNPNVEPYTGARAVIVDQGITFESVSFQYKDKIILKDLSLRLEPGVLTSVVGPNGSGKSTLTYLLLGFYRPQGGRLLAGDVPYDEIAMRSLRQQIAVIPQDPMIFSGTIWENITYGDPNPAPEAVQEALSQASALDFIQELPAGLNTCVGEKGMRLSGGQRQKLAIARALLRKPRVLFLDEPTNHLDQESTEKIIRLLQASPAPLTTLLITHDPVLAREADRIFTLDEGQLQIAELDEAWPASQLMEEELQPDLEPVPKPSFSTN